MADQLSTNAAVIAHFRANAGQVPAPYDDPPPMVLLHTIGAKSGREHIVPMRAMVDGDALYIFASAHGSPRHPDWYYNLRAHPEIVMTRSVGAKRYRAGHRDHPCPGHRAERGRARCDLRPPGRALPGFRRVRPPA